MGIFDMIASNTASARASEISNKNLKFQKEQFAYQRGIQHRIFARDDNAVQRRVTDLKKAGLSPTLAAGSSAQSSSPMSPAAPQKSHAEVDAKLGQAQMRMDMLRGISDITKTLAETRYIKQQGDVVKGTKESVISSAKLNALILKETKSSRVNEKAMDNKIKWYKSEALRLGMTQVEFDESVARLKQGASFTDQHGQEYSWKMMEFYGAYNTLKAAEHNLGVAKGSGQPVGSGGSQWLQMINLAKQIFGF